MEKASREGSNAVLEEMLLKKNELKGCQITYVDESPLHPITRESMQDLVERIKRVAKPKTVADLYIRQMGCEPLDLSFSVIPRDLFWDNGGYVQANAEFVAYGTFRKFLDLGSHFKRGGVFVGPDENGRIRRRGDVGNFIMHSGLRQQYGHEESGGFYIRGRKILRPEIIITEEPMIYFDVDPSLSKGAHLFLGSLPYPFVQYPHTVERGGKVKEMHLQYNREDKDVIEAELKMMQNYGLDMVERDEKYLIRAIR